MKPVALFSLLFLFASFNASAAGSAALRIVCDGDAEGAEVYINGKFKGECPLDMKVPEGKLKLRVQKTVDADHEPRRFEQEIRMGEGVVKTVEVQLGPLVLNAAGEKVIQSIEAEMVAIPGKNYAMGKYEITQRQWKAVMGNNPSKLGNCGDNCPVENVSWDDVQEFLQKLNAKTGRQYRLPSEAEWEYACYGGSQTKYCGGDSVDAVAWYEDNSGKETHPVGQKQANGYGLHDMSGNVLEWMEDIFSERFGSWRAQRGGSFRDSLNGVSANYRIGTGGYFKHGKFGFRLARTLP